MRSEVCLPGRWSGASGASGILWKTPPGKSGEAIGKQRQSSAMWAKSEGIAGVSDLSVYNETRAVREHEGSPMDETSSRGEPLGMCVVTRPQATLVKICFFYG